MVRSKCFKLLALILIIAILIQLSLINVDAKKKRRKCGKHGIMNRCGLRDECLPLCHRLKPKPSCFYRRKCVKRCVCKTGYVKKSLRGPCVKVKNCIIPEPPSLPKWLLKKKKK
ncbi:hypothetical protein SSS_06508 [Sarcoptes scabiei]|uniref:TIL domain-containing protein n=1 Tax=Sarcoptes scabiei TaxID=52283 RepID=A0A132A8W2_SARSC|nr:hypothetical protein SSS_06508 [Sarcoptes scabiei]KPM07388.1 hypothetical protein QR98_0058800 [Sarcoptes scabiei]